MITLSKALQESLLALLSFDDQDGREASLVLTRKDFDESYRDTAGVILDYWKSQNRPPKDHLQDLFADVIEGDSNIAKNLLTFLFSLKQISANLDTGFVLSKLRAFKTYQLLRVGVLEAAEILSRGDIDLAPKAEEVLAKVLKTRTTYFEPGLRLTDAVKVLFEKDHQKQFTVGIEALDRFGAVPGRGEILLLLAPPKRGKSWGLIHFGKRALMHRLNVWHVTLELSEDIILTRYIRSLFAIAKRSDPTTLFTFCKDSRNRRLVSIKRSDYKPQQSLSEEYKLKKFLKRELAEGAFGGRFGGRLIIKQFPTGQLTVASLTRHLELLEIREKFVPDVIIIDYADLLKVEADLSSYRLGVDAIYKELRGVAVEKNIHLITASQVNRSGSSAAFVDSSHVAEAFGKIGTADIVLTLTATDVEQRLNLARLYVANSRVDRDRFTVLLTQSYELGQFAIDSVLLPNPNSYKEILKSFGGV
jgi:hypothetical protein